MKIYLISQKENTCWDTYDSAVVYAKNREEAKTIYPSGNQKDWKDKYSNDWCEKPSQVKAKYIGEAIERKTKGLILSSYRSG